jgi:FMN reductase (NADPH)/FMN reductase [NAD(P)H]
MTNATLDLIHARRSVRAFLDQPLTRAEKDAILEAAMRAPTAGNMMLYSIIEVDDQVLKEKLVETCDNQPFIARSSFVLIFLADYQRWVDYFEFCDVETRCIELGGQPRKPQEGDFMLATADAIIAAQTAALAAESLGIGSCYIGDVIENYETHRETFSLPLYAFPAAMLVFGYPRPAAAERKLTPRYDREFIVHRNAYQRVDTTDMDRMASPINAHYFSSGRYFKGANNLGQHFYLKKFTAEFSHEMSRSVRAALQNWSEELSLGST